MRSSQQLAALALRLNRDAGGPPIPSLYFFTDPARTPDPLAIAKRLPRGTAVVYRHFGAKERTVVARDLATLCRSRGLVLLIAADPDLAQRVGAAGVHWPEARLQPRQAPGLMTAAAHSAAAIAKAHAAGADACFLSPIFETQSAGSGEPRSLFRTSQIVRAAALPIIALGGVNTGNARKLIGRGFAGLAAIDALKDV